MQIVRSALRTVFFLVLLTLPVWLGAQESGHTVVQRGDINDDSYLAGAVVYALGNVRGDVVAAGGVVTIENEVSGDVLAAGGRVAIRARVGDDVRAVGGDVSLSGTVGDDAIIAGGNVMLAPTASVGGRAWLAGGNIEVDGKVGKELRAAGGHIIIGGRIRGDVELTAERIEIRPGAVIFGNLHYRSPREAQIDDDARIVGIVTHDALPEREGRGGFVGALARLAFTASLMLTAIVMYLLFPAASVNAARAISNSPWQSLGLGLAVLASTPLVIVLLFASVFGAWLALALLVLYLMLLLIGYLTGVLCLGELGLAWVGKAKKPTKSWRVLAIVATLLGLWIVGFVPFLRGLVGLVVLLVGMGGLALYLARGYVKSR